MFADEPTKCSQHCFPQLVLCPEVKTPRRLVEAVVVMRLISGDAGYTFYGYQLDSTLRRDYFNPVGVDCEVGSEVQLFMRKDTQCIVVFFAESLICLFKL